MNSLQQTQNLDVVADCRLLVDLWQEYRHHSREMYRCKREIRGICRKYGMVKMRFISLLLALIGLCAQAQSVTLAWDPSPTPGVTYVLWYGVSGGTPRSVDVGGLSVKVDGLTAGTTYFFTVRAKSGDGTQSGPSNEVGYTPPPVVVIEVLPPPWKTSDIGIVETPGSAFETNGTFTLTGSGELNGRDDVFRFVNQPISGDGDITARLVGFDPSGVNRKLGVMIRESVSATSKYFFCGLGQYDDFRTQKRTSTGGKTTGNNYSAATLPDAWVRLVRQGNNVIAYRSTNGATWVKMNSASLTMTSEVQAGLVIASGATSIMSTGRIANVLVTP